MWLKVVGGLMDHGVLSANCSVARDAPRFLDDHDVQRQEQTLGINILFYGRKGLQHEHASALRIPQRDHVYTLGRWDWTCSRWRKN